MLCPSDSNSSSGRRPELDRLNIIVRVDGGECQLEQADSNAIRFSVTPIPFQKVVNQTFFPF